VEGPKSLRRAPFTDKLILSPNPRYFLLVFDVEILKMTPVSETELIQIKASLRTEYSEEDIKAMLKTAKLERTPWGVTVSYNNGAQDKFLYQQVLVHESELQQS
jgi:hypothetical protein